MPGRTRNDLRAARRAEETNDGIKPKPASAARQRRDTIDQSRDVASAANGTLSHAKSMAKDMTRS